MIRSIVLTGILIFVIGAGILAYAFYEKDEELDSVTKHIYTAGGSIEDNERWAKEQQGVIDGIEERYERTLFIGGIVIATGSLIAVMGIVMERYWFRKRIAPRFKVLRTDRVIVDLERPRSDPDPETDSYELDRIERYLGK
jgi:hypothetical protein